MFLLCGRNADTKLDAESLIYVSPTEFEVRCQHDGGNDGARYLHLPTIASPARLCAQLTDAARGALPAPGSRFATTPWPTVSSSRPPPALLGLGCACCRVNSRTC